MFLGTASVGGGPLDWEDVVLRPLSNGLGPVCLGVGPVDWVEDAVFLGQSFGGGPGNWENDAFLHPLGQVLGSLHTVEGSLEQADCEAWLTAEKGDHLPELGERAPMALGGALGTLVKRRRPGGCGSEHPDTAWRVWQSI